MSELENQQGSSLDVLVRDFESAWQSGSVGNFAESIPAAAQDDKELLTELACIDLEQRLRQQQTTCVEFYTTQFPQLAEDDLVLLELIRTEHTHRPDRDSVEAETYCKRFPKLRHHIEMMFRLELNSDGNSHTRTSPTAWNCISCDAEISDREAGATSCPKCGQPFAIGRYVLTERVGEGAFGFVYRARDPKLDREVALKLPRSRQLLMPEESERFLRESRSVAHLDHPGIVRVFDTGQHDNTPYIISEFVDGEPLSDALATREFEFRQAAEVALGIAEAVAHAHGRGVIHRDLKPSNIMMDCDEQGRVVPRVMDFGLARRKNVDVTVTMDGQLIGTPAYMSPEQARGDHEAVGVQSDVYSLGVILFQMLSGEVPFRGNVQRLIQQVTTDDPPPPSRYRNRVPTDLETICVKAISREPKDRYATVHDFATDLRCYLEGRPIEARPISFAATCWRWACRRPAIASLSAALLLAVIVGFAGITSQWLRAEQNAIDEAQARQDQATARKIAEDEVAISRAVTEFLNETLSVAELRRKGRRATIVEAVDAGVARIDEHFKDQPIVEAEVRFTVGRIYRGLGRSRSIAQFKKALELYEEHLGPAHEKTLLTMDRLAGALRSIAGDDAALREAYRLRNIVLEANVRQHGETSEETVIALNNLALICDNLGDFPKAIELYKQSMRISDQLPEPSRYGNLTTRHNIALAHWGMNQPEVAEKSLRAVAREFEQLPDFQPNRDYCNTLHVLAGVLADQDKFDASNDQYSQAHSIRSEVHGPKHKYTLSTRRGWGRMLVKARRFEAAETIIEPTLKLHNEELGPADELTITVRRDWFRTLIGLERQTEAEQFLAESIAIAREIRGDNSSKVKMLQQLRDDSQAVPVDDKKQ